MAALPVPEHTTASMIYDFHAAKVKAQTPRGYIGWSGIGAPCDRSIWYGWRWCDTDSTEGRIARLFDTGHREEERLLGELRSCGLEVWDRNPETRDQFAVSSLGGHLRGHLDAVVRGLAEAPKTAHVVDVKTVKSKKMDELEKKGMAALYPKYVAQGQGYMGKMGLERAAFIFVCKDDERILIERLEFDQVEFDKYEQRAARIIRATEPPLRVSDDPAWHECKYCAFRQVCHFTEAPLVNCRTCTHSTPVLDDSDKGAWRCDKFDKGLSMTLQRTGCKSHRYIPVMLEKFARPIEATDDFVVYEMAGGARFFNGEPPEAISSEEIRAAHDKRFLVDHDVTKLRQQFSTARIVA